MKIDFGRKSKQLIDCRLTSNEHYISCTPDENEVTNNKSRPFQRVCTASRRNSGPIFFLYIKICLGDKQYKCRPNNVNEFKACCNAPFFAQITRSMKTIYKLYQELVINLFRFDSSRRP